MNKRDNAHTCLQCNREWRSVSEFPESCPGCGSYSYDLPPGETTRTFGGTGVTCQGCGATWILRGMVMPQACKQCNRVLEPSRHPWTAAQRQIASYTDG